MTSDDETLSDVFWAVARRLRQQSKEALAPWDIAPSHFRAIAVLARHGTMRQGELADHLRIAARSTTEVVDGLEERGLVERTPDPKDRRAILVGLTGKGAGLFAAVRAARQAGSEEYFGALSEQDRADLTRILGRLRQT
ncbi:MAG: MarR family transcriptional regulator [Pseudonocardia sp.]|nr:MarR family transcriptional regulator [Pseudonocardia sp.]